MCGSLLIHALRKSHGRPRRERDPVRLVLDGSGQRRRLAVHIELLLPQQQVLLRYRADGIEESGCV